MSGRRPRRSSPCPRPVSAVRTSVQSVMRTSGVHGVRCPRDRCHPGVRTDGPPVSAALQPRCPDRAEPWNGSVRRAVPVGRNGFDVPPWSAGAWSPACIGPEGKEWCCVGRGWLARGSTADLDRRIARTQAAAPPRRLADKGAGPAPGCWSVGWGVRERAGAHQSPQVRPRQVAGVVPDHGLDREVVTTLRGRWAGDGPVSSVPEGPSGSAGGADCGRSAAATRNERRPLPPDSALTSSDAWWARQGLNL
jgi:hypothetical protein